MKRLTCSNINIMDKNKTLGDILTERQQRAENNDELKTQISSKCKLLNGKFCQASTGGCKPIIHSIKYHCIYAIAYQRGINDAKNNFFGCSDDTIDTSVFF